MKQKIVVFDLDGVLVDSIEMGQHSSLYVYPEMTTHMYRDLHRGNFHEELAKVTLRRREETEEERQIRKDAYAQKKSQAPLYSGMAQLVKKIHEAGCVVAINSSAYEKQCLPVLENNHIAHLFDFIGTADISKSKVEKFKMIQEKYSALGDEMIFVTDTVGDLKEASAWGIPTVAVTWGLHNASDFAREAHTHLLGFADSVDELDAFIFSK